MTATHPRLLIVLAVIGGVLLVFASALLGIRGPADAAQRIPERNTSPNPDCASQPQRPLVATVSITGQTYQIVGGIDADGCDSWPYELASSVGVYRSFFAGAGFGTAVNAIVRTNYGSLFDLRKVIGLIFSVMFRDTAVQPVPVSDAWTALALTCVISLWLLSKRVKAFEAAK